LSNIIKAAESTSCVPFGFEEIELFPGHGPCASLEDEDASFEAEVRDPLKELEQTIQERLLDAERRAQEIEREAYEQGYAQGLKDGTEFGRKSMLVTQEQMEKLFSELRTLPAQVLQDYRNWLVASCLAISKHVIQKELRTRPQVLLKLIQTLLAEVETEQSLTLTLHPKDLALLTRHANFTLPAEGSERSIVVKTDPELERGGCRIESDIQLIDAGIDTRLAQIEQAFKAEGMIGDDVAPSQ
jgi:flagellar assembly protein FliH